jgi:hypothetical protein
MQVLRASSRWTMRAHSPAGTLAFEHLAGLFAFAEELGISQAEPRHRPVAGTDQH